MRIRNVKPEFYRSDDIDALTWEQRFMFIALFSYVDDNGVGRDREADICADLFAGDFATDPVGTITKVQQCMHALVQQGLIVRYITSEKPYLCITGWDKHQYVKNPNRERYPRPDQALLTSSVRNGENLRTSSPEPTDDLPPVVGSRSLVVGSELREQAPLKQASTDAIIEAEFDGFWSRYPRKVGKQPALRAYRAARKKTDLTTIAAALHAFSRAMTNRDPDKIPYPATWLNSEPWHDDPDALAPKVTHLSPKQQQTNDLFDRMAARARDQDDDTHEPKAITR